MVPHKRAEFIVAFQAVVGKYNPPYVSGKCGLGKDFPTDFDLSFCHSWPHGVTPIQTQCASGSAIQKKLSLCYEP